MRFSKAIFTLLASAPLAFCDVAFSVPAAGASLPGGTAFTVTWTDSGDAPLITDLSSYTLFLFSGSNASPAQLYQLAASTFAAGDTVSVTVPVGISGTGTNAYFLGMLSVATAGGTIWNYSSRFTLTGMTGTFSTTVQAEVEAITDTTGPDTVNNLASNVAATSADEGAWGTPYYLQTGLTRYAPMAPVPGSAITATNTAPLFPTSSVSLASTFLPIASIVTTLTQAQTHSISSHANTAAAASQPTDDMAKFLARWKD